MKKELYTLDEADAIWTTAIQRGYANLKNSLSQAPQISSSNTSNETSTFTR